MPIGWRFDAMHPICLLVLTVLHQPLVRGRINHGADIGCGIGGIADDQRIHRAAKHFEDMICNILLYQEQAKRRAALARRTKCRRYDVNHNLFGKRG